MPPRVVKKVPGPGRKTAARATKSVAKQMQNQADGAEDAENVELKKEIHVEEVVEVKSEKKSAEDVKVVNGSVARGWFLMFLYYQSLFFFIFAINGYLHIPYSVGQIVSGGLMIHLSVGSF